MSHFHDAQTPEDDPTTTPGEPDPPYNQREDLRQSAQLMLDELACRDWEASTLRDLALEIIRLLDA